MLGLVDEVILLPIAISLIARLIPAEVMAESRVAAQAMVERPRSKAGAAIIIGVWVLAAGRCCGGCWSDPMIAAGFKG